jgi:hypothetical protein
LASALDGDPGSADAVRQKAGIPGNGTVHLDDQFCGSGGAHGWLLENEEIGTVALF